MVGDWAQITLEALRGAWEGILMFLPKLIGAIIVFLVGWLISVFVGKVIAEILKKLKLDRAFDRTGWQEALEKAEIKISPSIFIGEICKWILVIVFLMAAVEVLGFYQFSQFLGKIVSWLPNLIVAIVIFVVAVIVADILEKIIKASTKKIGVAFAGFLGGLAKTAIYVFAGFAILLQLGIAQEIIRAIVFGLVFALSLALGLSFGLGGKDAAAKIIEEIRKKVSEK
jgi:small-conductance mechanosensitive channel